MENLISERENRLIARATQGVVVALGDRLNSYKKTSTLKSQQRCQAGTASS